MVAAVVAQITDSRPARDGLSYADWRVQGEALAPTSVCEASCMMSWMARRIAGRSGAVHM